MCQLTETCHHSEMHCSDDEAKSVIENTQSALQTGQLWNDLTSRIALALSTAMTVCRFVDE